MKEIFCMAVLLVAMQNSFAQTYSISPNDTIEKYGVFEDLETLSIKQVNNSVNSITIKWIKVSESLPALWEATVCDNSTCNTSLVDNGTMASILPSDSGFLLLHITPHANLGTANVRYCIYDVNFPSTVDTLTYILHVSPTSTTSVESFSPSIIYVNHEIIIRDLSENIREYFLTDVNGKIMSSGKHLNKDIQAKIPITNFPNGMYFFKCISESNKTFYTKFLIQ